MWISPDDACIRLTGRWSTLEGCAVTTTPGASLEAGFQGSMALLHFDTILNALPLPHLWISVDGGPRVEVPLERYIRIRAADGGPHRISLIFKSAMEMQHRWHWPQVAKVAFRGMEAEETAPLPPDERSIIEFVGDSITEGVLVDADCLIMPNVWPDEQYNRPCQDDVTGTYAWQTAEALGMRPGIIAYGAVGVTKGGCGGVVAAPDAYPFCFENAPYTGPEAAVVVINHGTNDRGSDPAHFVREYRRLLDAVRRKNPHSVLVLLSPFCGAFASELQALAADYGRSSGGVVHYVDTAGWLPPEPIHPGREGHSIAAQHLISRMREIL